MLFFKLTNEPHQRFTLAVDGVNFTFSLTYCSRYGSEGVWSLSIERGGSRLVSSVPVLQGVDILRQHDIGIQNLYCVGLNTDSDPSINVIENNSEMMFVILEEGDDLATLG